MLAKNLSLLKLKVTAPKTKGQSQVIRAGTLLTAFNALQFEAFYSQNFTFHSQLWILNTFLNRSPKPPQDTGVGSNLLYCTLI